MKKEKLWVGMAVALMLSFHSGLNPNLGATGTAYGSESQGEKHLKDQKSTSHGEHEDDAGEEGVVRLSEEEQKQFGIQVAKVGPGVLTNYLELHGEVSINNDHLAHVVPRLSGIVREVRKSVGDKVHQGEVLAVIESRELADVQAEYLAALEKMGLAQAKFAREERLWLKKISAEQDYLDAKQALAEANIAARTARQKLHALGFSDDYVRKLPGRRDASYTRYEIVAPFNGTVIEKHITLGETLKEDTDAFLVADLSTVWMNFNVYPKDLPQVRQGQEIFIASGQGSPDVRDVIAYVSPVVKEETRTAMARVVLPNPDGIWRSGMFVTGRVAIGDGESVPLILPKTGIQTVEEKTVVFVETPHGFEAKPVITGRSNETHVEITGGLSSGEACAVSGTFTLKAQLSKGAFGDGHGH